jgi:hypothetical protein
MFVDVGIKILIDKPWEPPYDISINSLTEVASGRGQEEIGESHRR